jgi:hypothetical protein
VAIGMFRISICCRRIRSSSRSRGPSYCSRWTFSGELEDASGKLSLYGFVTRVCKAECPAPAAVRDVRKWLDWGFFFVAPNLAFLSVERSAGRFHHNDGWAM